jgi:hypothetical protein
LQFSFAPATFEQTTLGGEMRYILIILFLSASLLAGEHGIYLRVAKQVQGDFATVKETVKNSLDSAGFNILADLDLATPALVREEPSKRSGYKAGVLVLSNDAYTGILTSYGNKYLVAGMLRVGFYENNDGLNINIIDPETINRIVFNDIDNKQYEDIIQSTQPIKEKLITAIHGSVGGINEMLVMEPIRSTEALREADADMFMMVGDMTFFTDEDQFPVIYKQDTTDPENDIKLLYRVMQNNLKDFIPSQDDREYNWSDGGTKNLSWRIAGEIWAPDGKAMVFGITRPRTEGLSFHIAGDSRSDDTDLSPGLDHAPAYPIEVLILADGDELKVMTQRQMFRMDMYFWDAGKMAFMSYRGMPSMLDESIKKALLKVD